MGNHHPELNHLHLLLTRFHTQSLFRDETLYHLVAFTVKYVLTLDKNSIAMFGSDVITLHHKDSYVVATDTQVVSSILEREKEEKEGRSRSVLR